MNQIDADRFDELAETYSTQADHCRREAEGPLDPWALLAAAWTKLAEETKAKGVPARGRVDDAGPPNASQGLFLGDRAADHCRQRAL